jgi:hypothetical protein
MGPVILAVSTAHVPLNTDRVMGFCKEHNFSTDKIHAILSNPFFFPSRFVLIFWFVFFFYQYPLNGCQLIFSIFLVIFAINHKYEWSEKI